MEDRIFELHPLPIARAYLRLRNAAEVRERHDAAYYLYEVYLKYAASMAMAEYLAGNGRDHRVNAALKGLVRPSLGEWVRFLRECVRFLSAQEEVDPAVRAIQALLETRESRWADAVRLDNAIRMFLTGGTSARDKVSLAMLLDEIVGYRNRVLGHGAPLGAEHYRELGGLLERAFPDLLRQSPFLTVRRLVAFDRPQVTEGSRVECPFVACMGLHPLRSPEPLCLPYGAPAPKEEALHLLGEGGKFLSLDPFLVSRGEDVYFLNEADGIPEYLSYSTGERFRPPSVDERQRTLFAQILGYQVDSSRLSRLGEDCALALAGPAESAAGEGQRRLRDYRILRELGRGGMGTVFEAVQESLGRRVALKVLPGTFALDPGRLERFRREARATARIHHPSVVPVYEVGEAEGTHFYSMEFIDGTPLDRLLDLAREAERERAERKGSSVSDPGYIASAVEQMARLAEGVEQAHRLGLIHRDIKPSNVLVDRDGTYVLVDFGLVHEEAAETITRSGELIGTLHYMSPEQVSRRRVDARSDVYSLGTTLYEVLTLRPPFEGEGELAVQNAILFDEPVRPRRLNQRINRDLETIILRCLEKKPEKRYASAGELAEDLRRLQRYEPIRARPRSTLSRLAQRAWRRRGLLLATAALAVLGLTAGGLYWRAQRQERLRRAAEYEPAVLRAIGQLQVGSILGAGVPGDPSQMGRGLTFPTDRDALGWKEGESPIDRALKELGDAIAAVPDRPDAYYHRARGLILLDRADDALRELDEALRRRPGFVPAAALKANLLARRGEIDAARALRRQALEAPEKGWAHWWIVAYESWWRDIHEKTIEACDHLIEGGAIFREPYLGASIEVRLWRGSSRVLKGNLMGAMADFEVAAEKCPESLAPAFYKAWAYTLRGERDEAERIYTSLWERAPPERKGEVVLGILGALYNRDKYEEGLPWIDRLEVPYLQARIRAGFLMDLGRSEEAERAAAEALRLKPDDPVTWYCLAVMHERREDLDEAERCYRRAVSASPAAPVFLSRLGWFLRSRGRIEEALEHLEAAAALAPHAPGIHANLGLLYLASGREVDAFREHCKANRIAPRAVGVSLLSNLRSLLRRREIVSQAAPELDALLGVLEEEVSWGAEGERLEAPCMTLALGWIHHPLRPDPKKALAFAELSVEKTERRAPEFLAVLAEAQASAGDPRGAIQTLEEATRIRGSAAGLLRQLEELRRAVRPDLCSYRSIDDALDGLDGEAVIPEGALWRYFPGRREPSEGLLWTAAEFPDREWPEGPSGFGYADGDDATVLEDMLGNYLTLYIRKLFAVRDPASIRRLALTVRVDDGFVAYLNGVEVARVRAGTPGERLAHDAPADLVVTDADESSHDVDPKLLREGDNCIAIQGLNSGPASSDFSLLPELVAWRAPDPAKDRGLLDALRGGAAGPDAGERIAYLEARTLQRSGMHEEASRKLRDLCERTRGRPEPCARLAEALRALGKPEAAEETLRRAIQEHLPAAQDLWEAWARIAREDLAKPPGELLSFASPDDPRSWLILGSARWDAGIQGFILTEAKAMQAGRAFLRIPMALRRWTVEFEARIEKPGGFLGADGLTLAWARHPDYPPLIGAGLDFLEEGYAVQIDTYPSPEDNDPEKPHVALTRRASAEATERAEHLALFEPPRGIAYDAWHLVRVELRDGIVSVSFDGEAAISDFPIPGFEAFEGYLGFSAATGGGYQRHLVRRIRFLIP
ncbi:MAG: protein kinase [Planctomycetes bacterium]|nr:protein kinase [Planctomycetota bacterium]